MEHILNLDRKHRDLLQLKEKKQAELNALSKHIGQYIPQSASLNLPQKQNKGPAA